MIDFENINNDYNSYKFLIDFYQKNKNKSYQTIDISFGNVDWIAANTCAIIGAIFHKLQRSFNAVRIFNFKGKVEDILKRNGFLAFLGYPRIPDFKQTTIQYLKLSPRDHRYFSKYIHDDLLGRQEMPTMSERLKRKISEGIYEIFVNAVMHSDTKERIFTCGQHFPRKNTLEFMITDLGIGIKNRFNQYFNKSISAVDAIEWAMQERNTTKPNDSGGLGLSILREFVILNKGKIQIISNDGYWELSDSGINKKSFNQESPGTAINISIRTNDQIQYALNDEIIKDEDIF